MQPRIILASASVQRKKILSILNIPFEVIPADIDEKTIRNENLATLAEKIARAKAEKVARDQNGIVIAGDTFTECNGKLMEKPKKLEEAKTMLRILAGNKGVNYNGFCYIDREKNIDFSTTVEVEFKFRELSEPEIESYVSKFPVLTWAAAYSPAYPYVMTMIAEMKGSMTGFSHGLPAELVVQYLRKSGFDVSP